VLCFNAVWLVATVISFRIMSKQKIYSYPDKELDVAKLEEETLNFWKDNNIFHKSMHCDATDGEKFVFYDGPPFANGLPHYGHLLTGFIKDTFGRYHNMLGKHVERRFGWDCHGLPAEMAGEKDLGISGKVAIEEYGVEKFNNYCSQLVLKYTNEWQHYVNRQGRWVDFQNDYKTMDINYMESVLWAFKTLYDKGLIYESVRVMPYSWKCETPVSDFETKIDNSYRQKESKSITVGFDLGDVHNFVSRFIPTVSEEKNVIRSVRMLVWTTTPWTLPSNLALAVSKDVRYSGYLKDGICYIIASDLAVKHINEIGDNKVCEFGGEQLVGMKYVPLFDYFKDHENAFVILNGEFVTTSDGTGVVHVAPGFGEDDYILCQKEGIEFVCPVDNAGKFTAEVYDYHGQQVFDTIDSIIMRMKEKGLWIKTEQYLHNYPHCWRTDTPLIYKAISSWHLDVTAIKDKLIKHNQAINWIPGHIKDGLFGKWLENARDWSISRNRYWGCPIAVWKSDDPRYPNTEVYGSVAELEEAFGVKVDNLHRPFIDELVRPNPKDPTGRSMMRRVPEILDCWFESGSMPYAQVHYPFENKEKFEQNFPADFIVEYLAQTRGWFYTMMILSTALFDKPPFLNCICHGVILGEGKQKLSKRLQNYVDPDDAFGKYGADAMRWFMLSSAVMRGQELTIDKDATGMQNAIKAVIRPIWSAYNFFVMYANADQVQAKFSLTYHHNALDQYIVTKCLRMVKIMGESFDKYDTITVAHQVEDFVEIMNNWYIRRSRERFWSKGHDGNKIDAYNALYTVLILLSKAVAPMLPYISEVVFRGLKPLSDSNSSVGVKEVERSVHLESYPCVDKEECAIDKYDLLVQDMDRTRDACNAALFIRNNNGIRVRQPLSSVTFIGVASDSFSDEMKQLVLDEINVKTWNNLDSSLIHRYAYYSVTLNLPEIARRVPSMVQKIIRDNKAKVFDAKHDVVELAGVRLLDNEYHFKLNVKEEFKNVAVSLSTNDAIVLLDTQMTTDLLHEGAVRDVIRVIQRMRKDADLDITESVGLSIVCQNDDLVRIIQEWKQHISQQVLASGLYVLLEEGDDGSGVYMGSEPICEEVSDVVDYGAVRIALCRA